MQVDLDVRITGESLREARALMTVAQETDAATRYALFSELVNSRVGGVGDSAAVVEYLVSKLFAAVTNASVLAGIVATHENCDFPDVLRALGEID